jgi:hypothetical protein
MPVEAAADASPGGEIRATFRVRTSIRGYSSRQPSTSSYGTEPNLPLPDIWTRGVIAEPRGT